MRAAIARKQVRAVRRRSPHCTRECGSANAAETVAQSVDLEVPLIMTCGRLAE